MLEGDVFFFSEEELRVIGRTNLNRSLEGDVVAVEVVSPEIASPGIVSQRKADSGVSADLKEVDEEPEAFADEAEEDVEGEPDPAPGLDSQGAPDSPREARVVGIIRRGRREFCGTLRPIDKLKGTGLVARRQRACI